MEEFTELKFYYLKCLISPVNMRFNPEKNKHTGEGP